MTFILKWKFDKNSAWHEFKGKEFIIIIRWLKKFLCVGKFLSYCLNWIFKSCFHGDCKTACWMSRKIPRSKSGVAIPGRAFCCQILLCLLKEPLDIIFVFFLELLWSRESPNDRTQKGTEVYCPRSRSW